MMQKWARQISGAFAVLLFAVICVATVRQPDAKDVARAECVSRGVPAEQLAMVSYRSVSGLFGGAVDVEFLVKGSKPERKFALQLRRNAIFLAWRIVDFRDTTAGAPKGK
jgi:hypothetical protein